MWRAASICCAAVSIFVGSTVRTESRGHQSPPTIMSTGLARALLASGPDPKLESALSLFGQFVGNWSVDVVNHLPDGTHQRLTGEWHFGWILGGAAVQDVWMVPTRAQRDDGEALVGYGTTLRFYDPKIDAWRIVWASASSRSFILFTARTHGSEIVMEAENTQPPVRWIFSDVTAQSFRWRSVESRDGWNTTDIRQEMHARRLDSHDRLAEVLFAPGAARGFEAENRLFGQFAGDWKIGYEGFLPDGTIRETEGTLHVGWVLDGQVVQDVWRFRNPTTGQFIAGTTLRVFDARIGAWHSIWFYPPGDLIQAFVAREVPDGIVLDGSTPTGLPEQWIFSKIASNSFDWRAIRSNDNRQTWYVAEHMRITRVAPSTAASSR
jgi:hypothetical protein